LIDEYAERSERVDAEAATVAHRVHLPTFKTAASRPSCEATGRE
jgi:hypothetical protein